MDGLVLAAAMIVACVGSWISIKKEEEIKCFFKRFPSFWG